MKVKPQVGCCLIPKQNNMLLLFVNSKLAAILCIADNDCDPMLKGDHKLWLEPIPQGLRENACSALDSGNVSRIPDYGFQRGVS